MSDAAGVLSALNNGRQYTSGGALQCRPSLTTPIEIPPRPHNPPAPSATRPPSAWRSSIALWASR